ncbi:hypothetical protein Ntsu_33620 [Nocardia sp. IFM 10818]
MRARRGEGKIDRQQSDDHADGENPSEAADMGHSSSDQNASVNTAPKCTGVSSPHIAPVTHAVPDIRPITLTTDSPRRPRALSPPPWAPESARAVDRARQWLQSTAVAARCADARSAACAPVDLNDPVAREFDRVEDADRRAAAHARHRAVLARLPITRVIA